MDDTTQLNRGVEEREHNEEYIIDLTDIVEKGPAFIDKTPDKESLSNGETSNDEIIELTSLTEDDSHKDKIDVPINNPQLTDQQLETVLEKIIKEKFSQKIETTIFQVVEKVVEKEIADIKKSIAG